MNLSKRLGIQVFQVYFGGNWTAVNLQEVLADLTYNEAQQKQKHSHSILELVYHIHYFINAQLGVLQGKNLDAQDILSFNAPYFSDETTWQEYKKQLFNEAKTFVAEIDKLPEAILETNFVDEKYGDYYSNLQGVIEHSHYHLGQITLLKKMIRSQY